MTTHIISMTYPPKIDGVRDGTIRQTIRAYNPKFPFKLDDKLLIHGWSGKPYRSPWSWRISGVVKELDHLWVDSDIWALKDHYDLTHSGLATAISFWDTPHHRIDKIAKVDGIDPPTGLGLKKVIEGFHGRLPDFFDPIDKMREFQVIRW